MNSILFCRSARAAALPDVADERALRRSATSGQPLASKAVEKGSRGSSADEVFAEQQRRIRNDPEYRAEIDRAEAERAANHARWRAAEQPLLADLAAEGIEVNSVWELYQLPDESQRRAIPTLLRHIVRDDYPDRVLEGIGVAIGQKAALAWWDDLRALYLETKSDLVRDRLAAVLSGCARKAQYDDLLAFIDDEALGSSRIYFLRPISRIGNRMSPGRGRAVIESVALDPTLGKEATAILKGRSPGQ